MTVVAYMALAIPRLVRVEVVERLITACGHGPESATFPNTSQADSWILITIDQIMLLSPTGRRNLSLLFNDLQQDCAAPYQTLGYLGYVLVYLSR
jgi:hypothetical protein